MPLLPDLYLAAVGNLGHHLVLEQDSPRESAYIPSFPRSDLRGGQPSVHALTALCFCIMMADLRLNPMRITSVPVTGGETIVPSGDV